MKSFAKCSGNDQLTKNQVCNMLEGHLKVVPRSTLNKIRKDTSVNYVLKVEITLLRSLFGNEIIGKAVIRILDTMDSVDNIKELARMI